MFCFRESTFKEKLQNSVLTKQAHIITELCYNCEEIIVSSAHYCCEQWRQNAQRSFSVQNLN